MLASPCINLCKMDAQSGLCLGCRRNIDEITRWSRSDDAERALILAAVARRRAQAGETSDQTATESHG